MDCKMCGALTVEKFGSIWIRIDGKKLHLPEMHYTFCEDCEQIHLSDGATQYIMSTKPSPYSLAEMNDPVI